MDRIVLGIGNRAVQKIRDFVKGMVDNVKWGACVHLTNMSNSGQCARGTSANFN